MLHVFYIISPITELVADLYIKQSNIYLKEVLVLYSNRYYPKEIKGKKQKLDAISLHHLASYLYKNPFKAFINYRKFEKEINEITNGAKYIFYTPHLKSNMLDLIAHHPNCTDYIYIEEGALAYMGVNELNNENGAVQHVFRFGNGIKKKTLQRFDDFSKIGIGLYEDAFPFLQNKVIIQREMIYEKVESLESIKKVSNKSAIIVLDPTAVFKMSKLVNVSNAVMLAINHIAKIGITSIFFKFHPAQIGTDEETYYRNIFKTIANYISVQEISQETPLELVFIKQKNLTVFHGMSSLGLYAEKEGHKVFSYANVIVERDASFMKYLENYCRMFKPEFIPNA